MHARTHARTYTHTHTNNNNNNNNNKQLTTVTLCCVLQEFLTYGCTPTKTIGLSNGQYRGNMLKGVGEADFKHEFHNIGSHIRAAHQVVFLPVPFDNLL